jgi:uncharacterized protein
MEHLHLVSLMLGALVGVILGLTGAGGAIVAVPLLVFGLHLVMADAAPIALFAVSLSAASGAIIAWRAGKVRYRAAGLIAVTGMLTSPAGLFIAQRISNHWLILAFALVMAYVAFRMFRQTLAKPGSSEGAPRPVPCEVNSSTGRLRWTSPCAGSLALSGISAGFLSGLLGVGGGFIIVPALRKATDLQMDSIVATSLGVIALVSAAGAASAVFMGNMNWSVAIPFASGAIAAMFLASIIARRFSGTLLQQAFAILSGLVSAGMLVKAIMSIA